MKDFEAGVTAPPFHPNCRCCTAPYFSDDAGTRIARGNDGKSYGVPQETTFEEWKSRFEEPDPEADAEYAEIEKSGLFRAPSIDTFRELRYNNSLDYQRLMQRLHNLQGVEEWRAVEFNPETLSQHFQSHGASMLAESKEAYSTMALRFVNEVQDKESFVGDDKVRRFYLESTNELAAAYPDGTISTYFKPAGRRKYWERQVEKHGKK